jgi:hypothetical protein
MVKDAVRAISASERRIEVDPEFLADALAGPEGGPAPGGDDGD